MENLTREMRNIEDLKYYEVTSDNPIIIKLESFEEKNVYHYTTNIGVKSILKNNCLWVTRSDYLDDKSEIKYISKVLTGVVAYLKTNKELYDVGIKGQYDILESIIKTLEALREIYKVTAPIMGGDIYLLSLTANKSNKFLLENYAGENGAILEFANGIDTMFEEDRVSDYKISTFCAKVVYDYAKQMTLILEDINEFYRELITNLINIKGSIDFFEVVETIKSVIYLKIINYSLFFKDEKFSKEEECRIAFLVENDNSEGFIKHRAKGNKMVPYIEVKFRKESLSKVSYR